MVRNPRAERGSPLVVPFGEPLQETGHGFGVETTARVSLAFGKLASVDASLGNLQNHQPRANRLAPWDVFASRENQSPGRFGLTQLGSGVETAPAGVFPGCTKYSVGRRMISCDISAVALRREVIDDQERILRVKGQNLEGVPG